MPHPSRLAFLPFPKKKTSTFALLQGALCRSYQPVRPAVCEPHRIILCHSLPSIRQWRIVRQVQKKISSIIQFRVEKGSSAGSSRVSKRENAPRCFSHMLCSRERAKPSSVKGGKASKTASPRSAPENQKWLPRTAPGKQSVEAISPSGHYASFIALSIAFTRFQYTNALGRTSSRFSPTLTGRQASGYNRERGRLFGTISQWR
jgi:hypothetical protein